MQNGKYIGTVTVNNKVVFRGEDGKIYEKKIKVNSNEVLADEYIKGVNVNISCDNLLGEYVTIEGNSQPHYNKFLLIIMIILLMLFMLITFFAGEELLFKPNGKNVLLFILAIILLIGSQVLLIVYIYYVNIKKIIVGYKNYTEVVWGEIINYSRIEYSFFDSDASTSRLGHCTYVVMYKYKTKEGDIIHSLVQLEGATAQLLYKDYKLKQKVLVCYDPNNCCCSCLKDEYDCGLLHKKFIKHSMMWNASIGVVTGIETKCIDEDVEDYVKEYYLVDYVQCEYTYSGVNYKMYSLFSVPHNRFKLGEELTIFINRNNGEIFLCDINIKHSSFDKYEC